MSLLFCAAVLLACLGALSVPASTASAQVVPESSQERFVYRFARPGQATMRVYVWGQIGQPGIWEVARDTGLIELLSAARVPGVGVDQPQVRERVILTLYRRQSEGGPRQQVYSQPLEQIVAQGQDPPRLQEGDVVQLQAQQRSRFSFRDVTQYLGVASSLALLILRLTNVSW